jgi:hypothetical protein
MVPEEGHRSPKESQQGLTLQMAITSAKNKAK